MIYLDNAATTKPSKTALNNAEKFNDELFFNPSALYANGIYNSSEIKKAKDYILSSLGALNHEVVFTSCGSESDNQAIFCAKKRGVFVTSLGEHAAVYQSFLALKDKGIKTEFIPLTNQGVVDEEYLYKIVRENKEISFISIVHVNNETGAINDINKIAKTVKSINKDIVFHSDGVQAYGKLYYKLAPEIDLYSISAHKVNALKGTGALIKKKGLNLSPLIYGGGQENGYRSGTENIFGIKVFEFASREKFSNIKENYKKVLELKKAFLSNLNLDNFTVISNENSSPYILSVSANGLKGEVLTHTLEKDEIIVGNGSACSSKHRFSRVLSAMGYNYEVLDGVVRISFSIDTTMDEVVFASQKLNLAVENLKKVMKG